MSLLIKICGLTTREAAQAVSDVGADMAGFIFFEKSPRFISSFGQARDVEAGLDPAIARVMVTVNASDDELTAITTNLEPDYLQLHGDENPPRVAEIKAKFGIPVIKCCLISDMNDVDGAREFEGVADLLLFDAKPKADQTSRPGGWGESFNWQLLTAQKWNVPWLLAGGLTPDNVAEAITLVKPVGIDFSSGVETAPGVKSPELIEKIVAAAREAQDA